MSEFYVGQHVKVTRPCTVVAGRRHDLRPGQSGGVTAVKNGRVRVFFSGFDQFEAWFPVGDVAEMTADGAVAHPQQAQEDHSP